MRKKTLAIVFTSILLLISLCPSNSQTSSGNIPSQTPILVSPTPAPQPVSIQEDPKNQLGLIYTIKKLEEASELLKNGNIQEAEKIILNVKEWLTNATDHHYKLFQVLSKNLKTISASKIEKAHALDFAQARDQSYFLLAKVYILQNKLKEAVDLLVEIIKSQPDSKLANEAYKTLQEIKFSDIAK